MGAKPKFILFGALATTSWISLGGMLWSIRHLNGEPARLFLCVVFCVLCFFASLGSIVVCLGLFDLWRSARTKFVVASILSVTPFLFCLRPLFILMFGGAGH